MLILSYGRKHFQKHEPKIHCRDDKCSEGPFPTNKERDRHVRSAHPSLLPQDGGYCKPCQKYIRRGDNFTRHIAEKHKGRKRVRNRQS